jgi:ferric-dicitrate binding protein FerR (iron transport regulator)
MNDLLLYRYLRNETSEIETKEILDWIDADPDNQKYFDRLNLIYLSSRPRPAALETRRTIPLRRKVVRWSTGIAAAVALCVALNFVLTDRYIDSKAARLTTITVPKGQRINVTLHDGSDVWLNSGATLQYPAIFSHRERRVKVDGEAIFNVKKDDRASFIVETFVCDVKVLGTKFDVVAYGAENRFSVGLHEGSVRVQNGRGGESITMKPGETVQLIDGRLQLEEWVREDNLLWVDGIFSITGLTFDEVMATFEKYYNVDITIARENLPEIKLQRGKIRISDGLEHAMKIVQNSADFNYEYDRTNNNIIIN